MLLFGGVFLILLLSCQSFTFFLCEFYMSVNIVMLLGTSRVSRLHLEVYNCGRFSKTFCNHFHLLYFLPNIFFRPSHEIQWVGHR